MKWFFPNNGGGQEYGFHEAGVETFRGNINMYIAREAIQNCIDAQYDKRQPVRVSFQKVTLPERYDWLNELRDRFDSCANYRPRDTEAKAFFEAGMRLISRGFITALKISDFNTTGVKGTDDDVDGGWYNLVRSSGSSSKVGSEGGSFGIGKSAPFAASGLRTVLYSTLTDDNKYAFQGVARLSTHNYSNGSKSIKAQHVGYLGEDGASIRNPSRIPQVFRRNETGTDIFILGYQGGSSWQSDLKMAVVENFWVALMNKKLVVKVEEEIIDADKLPQLMEEYSSRRSFTAHHFYKAAISSDRIEATEQLPSLGEVSLTLIAGSGLPKRIAMVRNTGMVIYQKKFVSAIPYAGLFICDDPKGNERLRKMEPPRHDDWDKNRPSYRANVKTLTELYDWIKGEIRSLKPSEESQISEIPDLYKWLPDDEDGSSNSNETEYGTEPDESSSKKPKVEDIPIRTVKRIDENAGLLNLNGSEDKGTGSGAESGGSAPGGNEGGGGGNAGSGSGTGEERNRSGDGEGASDGKKGAKIKIGSRIFLAEVPTGTYRAVLKAEQSQTAEIKFYAVGDDSVPVQVSVDKAWLDDGSALEVSGGTIKNLSFEEGASTKLYFRVNSVDRLSLEVAAYEA